MKRIIKKLVLITVSLWVSLCVSLCLVSLSTAEMHEAENVPWSGYWWPSIHGGLATGKDYRGHPAPLEKYDQLVQGTYPGLSANWYTAKYYDKNALSWFGLCWNWAQAATYENIEFFPSSENNILFRVGDKKGILTAANTANFVESENGSSPAVFHYWLLNYIQDQGKAFVADLDPGGELWSYPVYRFEATSSRRSGSEAVTVTIYYADDMVPPDYMGTQVRKKTYTYTLTVTGEGAITGGQWTGGSVADHPQGLTYVLEAASGTPYLDYDRAVAIARSADDFLEGDDRVATSISPGTYNLVLMNEDAYKIDCLAGDTVSLSIKRLAGSGEDMLVSVRDSAGAEIDDYRISAYKHTDSEPYHLTIPGGAPPYTLTIGQDSYLDPNVYVLTMDVDKAFQQQVPYIPSFMWSGFAVTNPTDKPVSRVFMTSYDNEGEPVHTGLGPITLKPGEKRVFLLNQLPWRKHEFGMIDRVMLKGDGFLNFVNLFGDTSGQSMSSFTQPLPQDDRIILPGAVTPPRSGQKVFAQILNPSGEDADVMLKLFSGSGALIKQVNTTIAAGNKLSIQPGRAPFHYSMSNTDWIEVSNSSGSLMSGFQAVSDSGAAEVVAMPEVTSTRKIIPHIPPDFGKLEPGDGGDQSQ